MKEVLSAVREGLPSADQMPPSQVFERVLSALRQADAKLLDSPEIADNQTVLFAPPEFLNDISGRFYSLMAKRRGFQILTFRSE